MRILQNLMVEIFSFTNQQIFILLIRKLVCIRKLHASRRRHHDDWRAPGLRANFASKPFMHKDKTNLISFAHMRWIFFFSKRWNLSARMQYNASALYAKWIAAAARNGFRLNCQWHCTSFTSCIQLVCSDGIRSDGTSVMLFHGIGSNSFYKNLQILDEFEASAEVS